MKLSSSCFEAVSGRKVGRKMLAATRHPPSCLQALCVGLALLHLHVGMSQAQSPAPAPTAGATQAKTDPTEETALNAIFRRWNLVASGWNLSGQLCSGVATDSSDFDSGVYNPTIICDCTFNGGTTCYITKLRIYALNVVGSFPQEIQNLTHLINLNLAQNYLTGPLPAFIGNLTSMQYITFGTNALSGPLPKGLGNLKNLVSLGMGSNNFSGSLPPEFGNLASLEQLYMDSAGVSGDIPSSLSKLKNLKKLWASDNNFTGRIPDFIGTWTNLTDLRLQGNSFQGPIPSSLVNLTLLTNLRIGDILNGSSTLDFVKNMNSLTTLVIRNSRISDTIPSSFGQYTKLQMLDLSFNNLTGQLPASLFNLSLLQYLFLGNNSLSGGLPAKKSASIQNVDLSYNQLSGAFPDWVSEQNLQLNLVANNFVLDDSNSSVMPSGLQCLQQNIPCNRGSPIYYSFGINCGGNKNVIASDGITYEPDNQNLTTASYYVTDARKWGVSSIGRFVDAPNPIYTWSVLNQFPNTLDTELFQTARLSPSSLRYYGLGLENGNYTIKLQFAETAFPDTLTWQSVGRRIFDIYIQGVRREKNFNIRKEAGGSFLAFVRNYEAAVTNNFLEIHFFWAGKGTCCIPTQGYYGPAVSAVSISPNFKPSVSNRPPSSGKKNTGHIVGVVVGVSVFLFLLIIAIFIWRERRKRSSWHEDEELLGLSSRSDMFSYAELRAATEDFSPDNKLGEGGFGTVFKGKLSDGRVVAVKQLSVASNQGKMQFVTEISTIYAVQHRNLVKLHGCCVEGDKRLLVYEYLENKSLDQALFGKQKLHLDWPTRFEICLGTARGLAYLHEESRVRIVHRDVKASNILLDSDLNPKISDFGLAKLYDDTKTHISTRVAGTIGYLAPEYAMRGHLTEKTDVFAFGVVALEILSGRSNADTSLTPEKVYLLEWAWHLHENDCELEMVDPTLSSYDKKEALRVIGVALLCIQSSHTVRPSMSRVVAMLAGDIEVGTVTSRPGYLTDWQFSDVSSTLASSDARLTTSHQPTASTSQVNVSFPSGVPTSPKPWEPMLHEFTSQEIGVDG